MATATRRKRRRLPRAAKLPRIAKLEEYKPFKVSIENWPKPKAKAELDEAVKRYAADKRRSYRSDAAAMTIAGANAIDLIAIQEMATIALRSKFSGR